MTPWTNQLYFGDNLSVLREHIPSESVDLIYLDPPFNSNATYNVLFKERSGEDSAAQITAFDDTWHWTIDSERAYQEVVTDGPDKLGKLLQAMRDFLGQNDMMAYLTMMAQRLAELHRVLKPTGSIYLHCDPTASHYLKLLMDAVFGLEHYRTEISWKRTSAHNDTRQGRQQHGHIHDVILFYTKTDEWTWNPEYTEYDRDYVESNYRLIEPETRRRYAKENLTAAKPGGDTSYEWRIKRPIDGDWEADLDGDWIKPQEGWEYKGVPPYSGRFWAYSQENMQQFAREGRLAYSRNGMPRYKQYLDEMPGVALQDLWIDISPLTARSKKSLGFKTQKPDRLLERIIRSSSNEGDIVLDPFCGCGTAIAVAEDLKRRWIGIDVTHVAISLMKHRLHDSFGNELSKYQVVGLPEDVASAHALATESEHDGRYQFEYWALGLVDARPATGKKGADSGIDGYINFFDDNSGKAKRIIVQVKSGHVNRGMIATLKGDMDREDAAIGIFITLEPPTEPMRQEAIAAGFYEPENLPGNQFPRVQILTIEQLLNGDQPDYPRFAAPQTFRKAPRRKRQQGVQQSLDA